MVDITATVESIEQAKQLVEMDIQYLYFGDEAFGLRLPKHFTRDEIEELVQLAHHHGKKVQIAVNAIMHPDKMLDIPDYLTFLETIGVDVIVVGDPGVIHVLKRDGYDLPFIYDAATMVTSARQMNFWGKRGAIGAVIAREVPYLELVEMSKELTIFGETLVYGATCIHQSKRPLVDNYLSFVQSEEDSTKERGLFISEPKDEDTHYSIYEDQHGTHIFATNDVNLMLELNELVDIDMTHWKLDGIYTPGEEYVNIVSYFIEAKTLLESGKWDETHAHRLNECVKACHPLGRSLDEGFYYLNPDDIK